MTWDLGLWGVLLLVVLSVGFGLVAGLLVGGDRRRRLWAAGIATVGCVVAGLLTSEGLFGWATEEDLQPNVDGLSRDEVLLSSLLTTLAVVVVLRRLRHRAGHPLPPGGRHAARRTH